MESQAIISCYNCGCLIKQNEKPCISCGAINVQVLTEASPSAKGTHYVFQTTDHHEGINEEDFTFPEVEVTPPSLEDLLHTYLTTLEQLRNEGCLFYSIIHHPKTANNDVQYAGLPEDVVESVGAIVKVHFPLIKKRKPKVISEEELMERKYSCPEPGCDYRTRYSWQVKNHLRQHTGEKPFACNRCNFRTADSSRLLKHNRAHDLVTSHRCKICDLGFTKLRGLVCHMRLSHGVTEYEVEQPDADRPYPKVRLQQSVKAKPDHIWKCDVCDLVTHSRASLAVHRRVHTGERPFPCDKCAYRARQKESLKFHMKSHEDMASKSLVCEFCSFRTNHSAALSRHCKLFHPAKRASGSAEDIVDNNEIRVTARKKKKVGPWKCYKCDFEASTRLKLENHRKMAHPKVMACKYVTLVDGATSRYRCKRCNFASELETEILDHLQKHEARRYNCSMCSLKFTSMTGWSKHMVAVHGVSEPNKCDKCEFSSSTYAELIVHRKDVHRKKFVYFCQHCSFKSTDKLSLDVHEDSHKENSVAFICLKCGFTCYNKFDSKVHQSTHFKAAGGKMKTGRKYRQRHLPSVSASSMLSTWGKVQTVGLVAKHSPVKPPTVGDSVASLLKTLDSTSSKPTPTNIVDELGTQSTSAKGSMPKLISLLTGSAKPSKTSEQSKQEQTIPGLTVESGSSEKSSALVSIVKPRSSDNEKLRNALHSMPTFQASSNQESGERRESPSNSVVFVTSKETVGQ